MIQTLVHFSLNVVIKVINIYLILSNLIGPTIIICREAKRVNIFGGYAAD